MGGCDRRTKRSGKELPLVQGHGQKPGGPHARRAAAKRSYRTSEVRGSGQECQAVTVQEWARGATLCSRPGAVARRSHLSPEARGGGWREQPHVLGAVAARVQEGLEEISDIESKERRW